MTQLKILLSKIFPLGTRTLLFGVHCFFLHPIFVAIAWVRLYGVPWHPLIWLSFIFHDVGYLGRKNIDADDGENHPLWGACLLGILGGKRWFDFSIGHSRFYAKKNSLPISKLCVADKFSIVLMPSWLYLLLANLSGEIYEYMQETKNENGKYHRMNIHDENQKTWLENLKKYLKIWVKEHKNIVLNSKHRKNFVNWSINQLNLDRYGCSGYFLAALATI